MNAAEIHLMLNHVPILGSFVGLALLAWGLFRDHDTVIRTGMVLLVAFAVAGGATYLTGEPAEEIVEDAVGVTEAVIEEHEEFAVWGLVGSAASGLAALAGLILFRGRRIGRGFATGVLLLTVVAAGTLSYTAFLGGRINHPEIRGNAPAGGGGEIEEGEEDHEEAGRRLAPGPA